MKTQILKLDQINTTDGTQVRPINLEIIEEYRELLAADPQSLPPVEVFSDGSTFWLADGFHRHESSRLAGLESITANVEAGGRMEALKRALGANVEHGYRRTRADKRHAVRKALEEFPEDSNRMIAALCHVSPTFVGKVRDEGRKTTVHVGSSAGLAEEKRVGKDGKARRMPHRRTNEERVREREAVESVASGPGTPPEATPAPAPTALHAREVSLAKGGQAETVESALHSLDKACGRVVSIAEATIDNHARSASKVRSLLNNLRAQLDQIIKGSLPKKEALEMAA